MKDKILNILNVFITLLILLEVILVKSIISKIAILFVIILFLMLFFKKRISISEQKKFILLLGYTIIFVFNKIYKYDLKFLINSLLMIAKIFSFPVIIYCIIRLFSEIKGNNLKKVSLINSTLLFIVTIIIMLVYKNYEYIHFTFLSLFLIYIFLSEENKIEKIFKYLILLIAFILSLLFNSIISFIMCLVFSVINIKGNNNKRNKVYISLITVVCTIIFGVFFIQNINTDYKFNYMVINPEYEIKATNYNISSSTEIFNMFKYYNVQDILFGIDYYNVNIENVSCINIFAMLGLLGFVIYLLLWKIILRKDNIKYDVNLLLILIYGFITNLFLEPIIAFIISLLFIKNMYNEKEQKQYKLNKKIIIFGILTIILSILLGVLLYYLNINVKKSYSVDFKINNGLKVSNDYKLNIIDQKEQNDELVDEKIYIYELKKFNKVIAEIIYVERKISDVIIDYITLNNRNNMLNINLNITENELEEILSFEEYNIEYEFSSLVGLNKMKLPIGYYKDQDTNMIIGRSIEYNTLTSVYDKNNKSTIYNLIDQRDDLNSNKKNIKVNANNSIDTYIIRSNKNLFKSDESVKEFINVLNNNSSWLTYSGSLCKLQYSIDPFTREGYGKILGRLIEKEMYNMKYSDGSIIYDALSTSALYALYNYTPRTSLYGVWLTNYTSTWLSKDYGTKAYYVDTRYNETIGYHLLGVYNNTNNKKYKDSFLEYADFIINEWNGHNSYKIGKVKMLSDYFSDSNKSNTHSSLNHQLALINYLYKAYEVTNDDKYLNIANDMLDNILSFNDKWIRDNGDLWYQVNPNGEFVGTDYEVVTLEDLIITQTYLYKIKNKTNDIITKYIKSKIKYLENKGYKIPHTYIRNLERIEIYIK